MGSWQGSNLGSNIFLMDTSCFLWSSFITCLLYVHYCVSSSTSDRNWTETLRVDYYFVKCDTFKYVFRSDLESVLVVILKSVFSTESSDAESSDYKEMVDALLNAATFSKSDDGSEKGMSFQDFRSWCSLVPTIRKFLGSLLMPPGPGFSSSLISAHFLLTKW